MLTGNCTAVKEGLKAAVSQTTVASVTVSPSTPYLVLRMKTRA